MKKYIFGAVLSLGILVSPALTQAAGLTNTQIQSILSLLSAFGADAGTIANVATALNDGAPTTSAGGFCHNFNSDLTVGSSGDDVSALNQALSSSGVDTTGNSSYFSENTAGDVVSFQAKYGIRQTGYVGPITRAKLNALYGCHSNQWSTQPTTNTSVQTAPPRPYITEITPEVPVGAQLLIFGDGFGGLENTVTFGNVNVPNAHGETIQRCTSGGKDCTSVAPIDRIMISVPNLPPGTYSLSLTNEHGTSNSVELKVIAPVSSPAFPR